MNTVKVSVADLIRKLTENRKIHIKDYEEAIVGYKVALEKELKEKIKTHKKNGDVNHAFKTVRPTSYVKDFDDALVQLEWTVDQEIELDMSDFRKFVQNEWSWQQNFTATTALYKGAR